MNAAIAYLEHLGRDVAATEAAEAGVETRTASIRAAMTAIAAYERTLSAALLDEAATVPGLVVHGVTDRGRLDERVPTLCFSVAGHDSAAIAEGLAARDVGVRSGHMYSPRLMARLGLLPGGAVRASLVHYNTSAEIARFGEALRDLVAT
jgi:selenocysteine lyase/cysteine desulfurase